MHPKHPERSALLGILYTFPTALIFLIDKTFSDTLLDTRSSSGRLSRPCHAKLYSYGTAGNIGRCESFSSDGPCRCSPAFFQSRRISSIPSCIHFVGERLPIEEIYHLEHPDSKLPVIEDKRTWRNGEKRVVARSTEWTAMEVMSTYADKRGWVTAKAGEDGCEPRWQRK